MIVTILMTLLWLIATVLIAIFSIIMWDKARYFALNIALAAKCKYQAMKTKNPEVKSVLNECADYFWYLATKQPKDDNNP